MSSFEAIVYVHRLARAKRPKQQDYPAFKEDLHRLYEDVDIDLILRDGIKNLDGGRNTRADLLANLPAEPAEAGHLILGTRGSYREFPGQVIGSLLDTRTRRAAVAFGSKVSTDSLFLQVCAHEIGHMFDLQHHHGEVTIPTAMCQSTARQPKSHGEGFANAWLTVNRERPLGIRAFPFSAEVLRQLHLRPPEVVRPGGGRFNGLDVDRRDLDMTLEPERDEGQVGEHLGILVKLTNPSPKESYVVPRVLRPELSTLTLQITRPDAVTYLFRPEFNACFEDAEELAPGESRVHPQILLRGLGGLIFPFAGRYRIEARWGPRGASAAGFEIDVSARKAGLLPRRFSRFLNEGAPRKQRRQQKHLNRLLKDDPVGDPFLAHLAFLKALNLRSRRRVDDLLTAVEGSSAPRAIRHAAALERCLRASDNQRREVCEAAKELFNDPQIDRNFHFAINSMLQSIDKGENS